MTNNLESKRHLSRTKKDKTKFIDIHETTSDKKGLWRYIEVFFRGHKKPSLTYFLYGGRFCLYGFV